MNDAHLHLIVNHFPIVGTIFGLGILAGGMFFKKDDIRKTAYFVLIVAAISGFAAVYTGEGAEEVAESIGDSESFIHTHEDLAETFATMLYIMGFSALLALVASIRNHRYSRILSFVTLGLAIAAAVMSKQVGTSGGEIRHTEIRAGSFPTPQDDREDAAKEAEKIRKKQEKLEKKKRRRGED